MDASSRPQLEIRPMTPEDLPDVTALVQAQGRNVHRGEYERFLGLEGARGFVLRHDGALQGAVTCIRYFESAFLGPVLLAPGPDSVGVGLLLVSRVLEDLQRGGVTHVDAEAGDAEAAMLEAMGFAPLRRTLVLERPAAGAAPGAEATTRMEPRHFLDVGALDAAAVGHGRKEYLFALMEENPEGARVVERNGEVDGYVLVRRSRRGYHVGPLVTREGDLDAAQRLLGDALERVAGWPVVVLAPENGGLLGALQAAGFGEVGTLTRMRGGSPDRELDADLAPERATEWLLGGRITG